MYHSHTSFVALVTLLLLQLLWYCSPLSTSDIVFLQAGQSTVATRNGAWYYSEVIVHGSNVSAIFMDPSNVTAMACGEYLKGRFCVFGHGKFFKNERLLNVAPFKNLAKKIN